MNKAWMRVRVSKLPKTAPNAIIAKALGVSALTLYRWRQDEYFQRANVAFLDDKTGRWMWDREILKLWVIAIGADKPTESRKSKLRDDMTQEAARAALGIPEDHTLPKLSR